MKFAALVGTTLLAACATLEAQNAPDRSPLSFFITSAGSGDGANLGGIAAADRICQTRAAAAGAGDRTWRAYLSTSATAGAPAINARDRIGAGPWYNARGVQVATNVADLHSTASRLSKDVSLTELGTVVNGRGDTPNMHDVLTGSQANGTAFAGTEDKTCANWTSNGQGAAQVGHHDRQGGGADPTSWNSAHATRGCSATDLQGTGGNGLFYCFAAD
jgi:outer membrane murein-binding lipoprotein Lpp